MILRPPIAALQSVVEAVWCSDAHAHPATAREHCLPTARMHLAVRLDGQPLRLYGGASDLSGHTVSDAVVAGTHTRFYLKDTSWPARSVGALLRHGASEALFACSAEALCGRHVALDQIWGEEAVHLRDRLNDESDPERQLALLQATLLARMRPVRGLHPQVAGALQQLGHDSNIGMLVSASGYSHKRFVDLFRHATGLTPKRYSRLLRFQKVLVTLSRARACNDIALAAGYSDQAHFNREFREFAGLTPQAYLRLSARHTHHVPVAGPPQGKFNFLQDRPARRA